MERKNDVEWPAIDHYPTWLCDKVQRFLRSAHAAASTIARAWRLQRGIPALVTDEPAARLPSPRHCVYRRDAIAALSGGTATAKLDGTNVGKGVDGTLYGRRWVIAEGTETYQKVPLGSVRAADVLAVRDAVAGALREAGGAAEAEALGAGACRFVVYGELMCNPGLYDYSEAGLAGAWLAFGVVVVLQEREARAFAAAAARAGFGASLREREAGDEAAMPLKVLLCGTHKLHALFCTAGLLVPEEVAGPAEPSAPAPAEPASAPAPASLVHRASAFMEAERGEGVVVALHDARRGCAMLRKWKIGREVQHSSRAALQRAMAALEANGAAAEVLLGPELASVVPRMWAILEHTGGGQLVKVPKKPKQQGGGAAGAPRPPPVLLTDPGPVADALQSALTKYDALESYFASASDASAMVQLLAGELSDEICKDLGYKEGTKQAAVVQSGTKRFVGMEFGAWKKKKKKKKEEEEATL